MTRSRTTVTTKLLFGSLLCLLTSCDVTKAIVSASQQYLVVMTFNIFHDATSPADERNIPGWSAARRDIVVGTIQSAAPDVVGLQEAYMYQVYDLILRLPNYAFVGRGRAADGSDESVSIL